MDIKHRIIKLAILIDLTEKEIINIKPGVNFKTGIAGMLLRLLSMLTRVRKEFDIGLNSNAESAGDFYDEVDELIDRKINELKNKPK